MNLLNEWRATRRYGITMRDIVTLRWDAARETFWHCRVRRQHQQKMDSHGACYRCGKEMR